jgi:hypothetical protein
MIVTFLHRCLIYMLGTEIGVSEIGVSEIGVSEIGVSEIGV